MAVPRHFHILEVLLESAGVLLGRVYFFHEYAEADCFGESHSSSRRSGCIATSENCMHLVSESVYITDCAVLRESRRLEYFRVRF